MKQGQADDYPFDAAQIGHFGRHTGFEKVDSGYDSKYWDNYDDKIDSLVHVKGSASGPCAA